MSATLSTNYNYNDIESTSVFLPSFQVSPNFTLGQLSSNARVSHYPVKDQITKWSRISVTYVTMYWSHSRQCIQQLW